MPSSQDHTQERLDLHIAVGPVSWIHGGAGRSFRHYAYLKLGRSVKGSLLVASSTSDNTTATNYRHGASAGRISFAKIDEPLDVPNLLALQTESFDRLVGNERWAAQVARAQEIGDDSVVTTSGFGEIFDEISPIEDYQGTMSLSFSDPEFSDPKMGAEEAKERDAS